MPIPKKIHYCWFGGKPLPAADRKWIDTWRKHCPDYEIIEWNESNYDVNQNDYVREAYKAKKWGFVTDYVRLDVVYRFGGLYFDTDVEVIKSFDGFLRHRAFMGFEDKKNVNTGVGFGAEAGLPLIKELRDHYDSLSFLKADGAYNLTPCPVYQTERLKAIGLKQNNKMQLVGEMMIYPSDYFSPKSHKTNKLKITENTHSIHHFNGSWFSDFQKEHLKMTRRLAVIFGFKIGGKIAAVVMNLKYYGFKTTAGLIIKKLKRH